jgi:hypothetical protein
LKILFSIALLLIISQATVADAACQDLEQHQKRQTAPISASEVKDMIRSYGARCLLKKYYNDWESWQKVLQRIASGRREWLEIAVVLKKHADAGMSETLAHAVGEALEHDPELVLTITAEEYPLKNICSGPDIDDMRYSTYDATLTAIEKRIDALKAIDIEALEMKRANCIEQLKTAVTHMKRFFGID